MLKPVYMFIGTDPEGFIKRGDYVIGAERVIPAAGVGDAYGKVVLDGVQFELHPYQTNGVKILGSYLSVAFDYLKQALNKVPGTTCCFDGVVDVSKEELDTLSPETRRLGCSPSDNVYGAPPIDVDPLQYRTRSAGGHLHLDLRTTHIYNGKIDERYRLIPLLDFFVGNFCVLLDRNPRAAERRINYGRAGEYRKPNHGVEYRTLSNFWLRNYTLMSFAFGMANLAVTILNETTLGNDLEQEIVDTVNIDNVIEAINSNNADLAFRNVLDLEPFFAKHIAQSGFPLQASTLSKFLNFAESVQSKGLETFFPEDPIQHWVTRSFIDFPEFLAKV